jgi:type VI secretion system secreted protein VgrG
LGFDNSLDQIENERTLTTWLRAMDRRRHGQKSKIIKIARNIRIRGRGGLHCMRSQFTRQLGWHHQSAFACTAAAIARRCSSAAWWGIDSKEIGGSGYNHLVFDNTDCHGRIQLNSSYAASGLNLGHLIHRADTLRACLCGLGAALRIDGYGTVHAAIGLWVTSDKTTHSVDVPEPAGDNVTGIALLKRAVKLSDTASSAAPTQQTVASPASGCEESEHQQDRRQGSAVAGNPDGRLEYGQRRNVDAARSEVLLKPVALDAGKLPNSRSAIIAIAAQPCSVATVL